MAKYRVEELSFIDNVLVQPGTEIESNATPSKHWTPLDKKAEKASEEAEAAEAARIKQQAEQTAAVQAATVALASVGADVSSLV